MRTFWEWLKWKTGFGYGPATVTCPYPDCGRQSKHYLTMRDGGQIAACPFCHRNMRIMIHMGQAQQTIIP